MRISDWSSDVCSSDLAVINRLGFNNAGLEAACSRLRAFRDTGPAAGPVGVNLGKNRDTVDAVGDYVLGAAALGPVADYLVVNVSSPNTPGLRALQGRTELEELLGRVMAALPQRSEERRVGQECVSTCRSRWWPYP